MPNLLTRIGGLLCLIVVAAWGMSQTVHVRASTVQQPEFRTVVRTFTPAELKALTTPIQVIPAPGAGYAILPGPSGVAVLNFATTPYTITSPGTFAFTWDGLDPNMYSMAATNLNDFFDQTSSTLAQLAFSFNLNSIPTSSLDNKAAVAVLTDALLAGDSPVTVTFTYYIQRLN